jgi:RecA-family ATPase
MDDITEARAPSYIDWDFFFTTAPNETHRWLIEPLVAEGRQTALFSAAKGKKSLLSLATCAAGATGRSILGATPREPFDVVYLDYEMTDDDLLDRLLAMGYGGPEVDLSRLHYCRFPNLDPLDTPNGGFQAVQAAKDVGAKLVVVDTMAIACQGRENSADTYRDFYRYTGMPLKQAGIALLRNDHEGKDGTLGQRGASAKDADVDFIYRLTTRDETHQILKRWDARVAWAPAETHIRWLSSPLRAVVDDRSVEVKKMTTLIADLDEIGVPADASYQTAIAVLKAAGKKGRRKDDILAAQSTRRDRDGSGTVGTNLVPVSPEPVAA